MSNPDQGGNMFNSGDGVTTAPVTQAAPATQQTVAPEGEPNQFSAHLATIVNEEGTQKYSDVSTALNSIVPAQAHIKTLETELVELRADLEKRQSTEELIKEMQAARPGTPPAAPATLDPSQIQSLVKETMDVNARQAIAQSNQARVIKVLADKYGDMTKAEEAYVNKAKELGMPTGSLDSLSGTSPDAVLAWFPSTAATANVTTSTLNASATTAAIPATTSAPKSVMGASDTGDLIANWKAAGEVIKNQQS